MSDGVRGHVCCYSAQSVFLWLVGLLCRIGIRVHTMDQHTVQAGISCGMNAQSGFKGIGGLMWNWGWCSHGDLAGHVDWEWGSMHVVSMGPGWAGLLWAHPTLPDQITLDPNPDPSSQGLGYLGLSWGWALMWCCG